MNQPGRLDIPGPEEFALTGDPADPVVAARHARHLSALALLYLRHAAAPRAMVLGLAAMAMGDLRPQTILLVAEALLQAGDPEQALTVLGRFDDDVTRRESPPANQTAGASPIDAVPTAPRSKSLSEPPNELQLAARDFLIARVLIRRGEQDSAREAFDRAVARAALLPVPRDHDDDDPGSEDAR